MKGKVMTASKSSRCQRGFGCRRITKLYVRVNSVEGYFACAECLSLTEWRAKAA